MRSKNPYVGIYFSHYECWGHTSRVIAVSEVFKNRFPKGRLFFIQAGLKTPQSQINQWGKVYDLPGALVSFPNAIIENLSSRLQMGIDILRHQNPHLFITEYFPLGHEECRHELIPFLAKASAQGTTVWSVAGYPLLTGMDHHWRHKILSLYKKIIIFSPSLEKKFIADLLPAMARTKYSDFFKRYEEKITFAGYLLPQQGVINGCHSEPQQRWGEESKGICQVAILRGGGAYYPKLIAQAIRASDLLGKEYFLTVIAGPSTTQQEWDFFNGLVLKKKINNLRLLKSISDYEGLIKNSDVCVSVASYHTSVMLMKYNKKAVLVPFEGHDKISCYEQPARALMLKEMMQAQVLSIRDLTATVLAHAIGEAAKRKETVPCLSKGLFPSCFSGAKVLDKALTGLFGP